MTNCNIVIPTFNRPEYFRRILNYYDSFKEKFKIIVADSSSDENKRINKDIVSSVSNLDILYLDNYSSEIASYHKFADAANFAQEKYCVFCADDDFVTPNGINQSVDFLEKNPDFTIAHGQYINFNLKDDEKGKQQFYWKPIYSQESITFSDPKIRLNYHLSNYLIATFYAVHRGDFLKMVYKEALESKVDPVLFGELLPSMLTLIYGKMKCLDVLYAVRDGYSGGNWPMTLRDAIKTGIYEGEYAKFRDCLSAHLSKQAQLDIEESKRVIDEAMSAYMKKSYQVNPLVSKMEDILYYLRLPDWIDKRIRALYRALFFIKQRRAKQRFDSSFSSDIPTTYEYYDDLNKIRLHVLTYLEK